MHKLTLLGLIFLFNLSIISAQKMSISEQIRQQFIQYHDSFPQEKVYIHHDKNTYLIGESIWFKAYVMDAREHTPGQLSRLLYVELIDPNDSIIARRNIKIDAGGGQGEILIDPTWAEGIYALRAYTQYMRNYDEAFIFQKEIPIYDVYPSIGGYVSERKESTTVKDEVSISLKSALNIQFFPEGGDLVEGLVSVVGLKAVDESGNGVKIQGWIKDEEGENVVNFNSMRFGLGFFQLKPDPGKSYYAEVMFQDGAFRFELPQAIKRGYVLKAQSQGSQLIMDLKTNEGVGLKGAFLIGHLRGKIFGIIEGMEGNAARFRIPTDEIPEGIAHFTLFNNRGEPVAERLVFIRQPNSGSKVTLATDQEIYDKRKKVRLDIELKDYAENLVAGEVSISVSDHLMSLQMPAQHNIQSYLLLGSELKGRIEQPNYFFEKDDPVRRLMLDLLMLTQGWRRFVWQDILEDQEPDLIFPNEDGHTFSGTISRLSNKDNPVKAQVFLTAMADNFVMDQMITGENGFFYFSGYQWEDTTDIIIQGSVYKEKKKKKNTDESGPSGNRNVQVTLDDYGEPKVNRENILASLASDAISLEDEIIRDAGWVDMLKYESMKLQEYDLEEVLIEGKKTEPLFDRFKRKDMLYRNPDSRIVMDSVVGGSLAINIFDFMRGRVPGVEIIGPPFAREARIRGINSISLNTSAQILLDGVPITNEAANVIDVNTVDFIDVLRGLSRTAVYGAAGSNGIIAIYTRSEGPKRPESSQTGIINIKHPAYYKAREFYLPTYDKPIPEHSKPDYRTTIYWKPSVRVGEEGKISLAFFTADRATSYDIYLEGMTSDAQPVVGQARFEVE